MILQTERLILREFLETDFEAVQEYASDLDVVRYMTWGPNKEQHTREFIRQVIVQQKQQPRTAFEYAVIARSDNRLIGACGISIRGLSKIEAEIGYALNKSYWNQGLMTEASHRIVQFGFQDLGLHRIYATCDPNNLASARVMEKVGMRFEGHLREHLFAKGKWLDSFLYSILEKELTLV